MTNFLDEILEFAWKTGARIESLVLPQESFKAVIANVPVRMVPTPTEALRFYYDSRWGMVELKVDTSSLEWPEGGAVKHYEATHHD